MEIVVIFYDHLEYFWSFGIFLPVRYVWTKKNLATLVGLAPGKTKFTLVRIAVCLMPSSATIYVSIVCCKTIQYVKDMKLNS
jgi:hypothetical protein